MKTFLILAFCFICGLGCTTMFGGWKRASVPATQDDTGLPSPRDAQEKAPDEFKVKFKTTKGDFIVQVTRNASPNGADRFYNLVKIGYFQDIAIFRAIEGFMFQFGIHGDPAVNKVWSEARINDDPRGELSNEPGTITFAKTGQPNSRSVQFFVNLGDNSFLDRQGFTPFGKVVEGMDVVNSINVEYGENAPDVQGKFQAQGNAFIKERYPRLDFIQSVELLTD
ncbi:MAG TPA: peptidylprolyl isomerase [Pirellulaceae bacterium]|nr:peptidylprolyl isomerase [Pirellulaceae bacterium]